RSGAGDRFDVGMLLTLGAAAHDRRRVRISHRARNQQTTERLVDPYGVAFQSGRWYLAGWDHLRGAARTFRLDRLQSVEVSESTFDRPRGVDPLTQVQQSIATAP